jgi:PAS domain S-box-containing protein
MRAGMFEASMIDPEGIEKKHAGLTLAEDISGNSSFELTFDEARRLCEYSLDIVCVSNFSGKVLWSNNVDTVITGYTKEELATITWQEITHPEDIKKVSESLQVVSQGELRPCTEIRIRCKDGSYKWISWSGVPVIEENKIYSIGRDVTAQKIAEAEVKKLAAIVQSSSEAIISLDDNRFITSWNKGAEVLYGYRADEVAGRSIAIILQDEERQISCLRKPIPHQAQEVQELHKRSDDSLVEVSLTLFPIVDEFGAIEGMAAIIRDISRQKAAERCIRQFYSITSHELRTPLSSIRGVLGLLEGGLVDAESEEGRDLINVARTSCDRLVKLISDILDARNSEKGALDLNCQLVEAQDLISMAVSNTTAMAKEAGIRVVAESAPSLTMFGDRNRLAQALTNLLSNAIKFSPNDSQVCIAATETPVHTLRFSVVDNGPGIPRHEREHLFKPFRQIDSSDSRAKEGVGLGLSIAKAIIEQHRGVIGIECERAAGSTFWFELPLSKINSSTPVISTTIPADG